MKYTVWYKTDVSHPPMIFISDVPSANLAVRIADALMDDMSGVVVQAWVEED